MKSKNLIRSFIVVMLFVIALNISNIIKLFYPLYYSDYITKYSKKYNLSPYLVTAVIKTESNFRSKAKSNKNAFGLMQITSSTAKWAANEMEVKDFSEEMLLEPEFNINMGCWYINNLKKEFQGDMDLVLAAYNGGRGNVQKWLSDSSNSKDGKTLHYIPFEETDKYVKKVKVSYNIYKFIYSNNFKD